MERSTLNPWQGAFSLRLIRYLASLPWTATSCVNWLAGVPDGRKNKALLLLSEVDCVGSHRADVVFPKKKQARSARAWHGKARCQMTISERMLDPLPDKKCRQEPGSEEGFTRDHVTTVCSERRKYIPR